MILLQFLQTRLEILGGNDRKCPLHHPALGFVAQLLQLGHRFTVELLGGIARNFPRSEYD